MISEGGEEQAGQKVKLGILLTTGPGDANSRTVMSLSQAALTRGWEIYLYLLDDGVFNIEGEGFADLWKRGAAIYVCALSCRLRQLPHRDFGVYGGLVSLANIATNVDRFLAFN